MTDLPDVFSPEEEADYQAWKARLKRRDEEREQLWGSREGLVVLADRPQAQAMAAFRASLPGFNDARRLLDLVMEELGDLCKLDSWSTDNERCLLRADPDKPGWWLPQRFIYEQTRSPRPEAAPARLSMHFEMPERLKRFSARLRREEPLPEPPEQPEPLSPGGTPGRFTLHEGASNLDITYGKGGAWQSCSVTSGDSHAFAHADTQPFTIDPLAKPPRPGPISPLVDPVLGDGLSLPELARLVAAMQPLQRHHGRVRVPCDQPGTITGTWTRALWTLKEAEWAGRVPAGSGWLVIDGWNGTALVVEPTFDQAVAAWETLVATVQPLPPVEGRTAEDDKSEDEPTDDGPALALIEGEGEGGDGPAPNSPAPDLKAAEALAPREDRAYASTGPIQIVMHPPVAMSWPPARPEHVAAAALPLPPAPLLSAALVDQGFDRVLRLFGEHGEVAFAFVRDDGDGHTIIGEHALPAIDPATLDTELDALIAKLAAEWDGPPGWNNPYDNREYPVSTHRFATWDVTGRHPELRSSGTSWNPAFAPRELALGTAWLVLRVRRVEL